MKLLPNFPDDEFLKVRYNFDTWKPTIHSRQLKMIKTGTWLFGLLGTYRLVYTDWIEE
jgi:hypothetical protein